MRTSQANYFVATVAEIAVVLVEIVGADAVVLVLEIDCQNSSADCRDKIRDLNCNLILANSVAAAVVGTFRSKH